MTTTNDLKVVPNRILKDDSLVDPFLKDSLFKSLHKIEPFAIGFNDLFSYMEEFFANPAGSQNYPLHNARKTDDGYVLEFALAGFKRDELKVEFVPGLLQISGSAEKSTDERYLYRTLSKRSFSRRFTLEKSLEIGEVKYENGVLSVELKEVVGKKEEIREVTIK